MSHSYEPQSIDAVAAELGVERAHVIPWGRNKAKVDLAALSARGRGKGRLILVSAITPTKAGEGKTTVSCSLAMGMRRTGRKVALCLREPSLGPVFGVKGGGTGGGRAQVIPPDDINLHFTGDIHAVGSAHNLLAALVDNELHFGAKASGLDPRAVSWPRVLDMNDRALRDVVLGLGGRAGGVPRESRFDITAASEVMAILCLSESLEDLRGRLGRIVVGERADKTFVTAKDLAADAAMTALLRDALLPNLVQTTEGGPAIVHGGPFANIAHGCSSVLATKLGMAYADYVVTEAGFGFDLGGEKFFDLKCRAAGVAPRAVVLVATVRALAAHGEGSVEKGLRHLDRQLENVAQFGVPAVVAINVFGNDDKNDLERIEAFGRARDVPIARSTAFVDGGAGATGLADAVAAVADRSDAAPPKPTLLYELGQSLEDKVLAVAQKIYGAATVSYEESARNALGRFAKQGYGGLPVCIAKTQLSFTDDPEGGAIERGFNVHVKEARLSAGAGFVVLRMGEMLTMPGLPKEPASMKVRIEPDGRVRGLMQND